MRRDRDLLRQTLATVNTATRLRHPRWGVLVERITDRLAEPDPVDVLQQTLMELMTRVNLVMLELPSPHSLADLQRALEQAQQVLLVTGAFGPRDLPSPHLRSGQQSASPAVGRKAGTRSGKPSSG